MRRGLEIFLLAFVFRIQAWILGWSSPRFLLRVDILNVMGPAIVMSAALWGMRATFRGRVVVFMIATLATTFLTPIVRLSTMVGRLPDPIEAYLRPVGSLTSFSFFPWAGFVFAGALLGVLLDAVRSDSGSRAWSSTEGRLNLAFLSGGVLLAVLAYGASFLPTPYARSDFWTSSPAFFFLRLGLLIAVIGIAYAWEKPTGSQGTMEPAAAARPYVALYLLDSRGDGLWAALSSASPCADAATGLARPGSVFAVHAVLLDWERPPGRQAGDPAGIPTEESSSRPPILPVIHYES